MSFKETINNSKVILTEGALEQRIKTEYKVDSDTYINHAGLIYSHPVIFKELYGQYIQVAQKHQLPIMLMTSTSKVNYESIRLSKFADKNVIKDACQFLNSIKDCKHYGNNVNIFIGGLLGCKGDAYSSEKNMTIYDSYLFHKVQIEEFQKQKIDFLFATTMPELREAIGMAQAMSETELPYVISFMIRKNGCLLDGTLLVDAITLIDKMTTPPPTFYMVNCIHPTNLLSALNHPKNLNHQAIERLKGIQANTSCLSPEELDNSGLLDQGNFDQNIDKMLHLHHQFNFNVLGGCCGTNNAYINELAKKIK